MLAFTYTIEYFENPTYVGKWLEVHSLCGSSYKNDLRSKT